MARLERFLMEKVDSDAIDREGKIPPAVVAGLAELGAFGMKIPKEYGGLGFTQREYGEAMKLITSRDANLIVLLSAHQSIGVPQPLKLFGTKEQKAKYLPRLRQGRDLGVRAHRAERRLRPRQPRDDREEDARGRLHPRRREALVHQRHRRRASSS